jgi:GNAT superfamily N-acetyltransferase
MGPLTSVAIRRATVADARELKRVEHSAQIAVVASWQPATDWGMRLTEPGTFTYLCEDRSPFGFVTSADPVEEYFRDGETGEILGLSLHPDYWGSGYGKKLLVHGITVLKRRGFEQAIMWIPDFAEHAVALSESLQFKQIEGSRVSNHEQADLTENCYKLDLTGYF